MLVQFTVDNFRSFGSTEVFSMVPDTKYRGFRIGEEGRFKLLPSSVFYGANASGKSNFLRALSFMKGIVLNHCNVKQSTDFLWHDPFLLSEDTEGASSSFEVVFIVNGVKYRYGFDADRTTVYSEWLFADTKGQEARLFYRDVASDTFYVNPDKFKEGKNLKCLPNWLFLWKCDQENGEISKQILAWFNNLNRLDGMKPSDYVNYTKNQMLNQQNLAAIENIVRRADLSIENVKPDFDENKNLRIITVHKKLKANGEIAGTRPFDLDFQESEGTKKFFSISAPLLDTLVNGRILLIDELDASLHPLLSAELVSMFNDPNVNRNNAQLIFTSHDTNLLGMSIFENCQIWFAEKDSNQQTHINSLSNYLGVNKRKKVDEQYLQGVFGAIPNILSFVDDKEKV